MARGGYRPGAGRPKLTEAEKAERARLRAAGLLPVKKQAAPAVVAVAPPVVLAKKIAKPAAKKAKPVRKPAVKKAAKPVRAKAPAKVAEPVDTSPPPEARIDDAMVKVELAEAALQAEKEQMADWSPLDYMLNVMRSPEIEPARRDRMAIAAAPFVHHRKESVGQGKREAAAGAAKEAARGKFSAQAAPPRLVSVSK